MAHAVKVNNLYKIIVFWYLSSFLDLHAGNLLFVPDFHQQNLTPVVIDAEYTWAQQDVSKNNPAIYQLHPAQTPVLASEMQTILNVSKHRLLNLFNAFPSIKTGHHSQHLFAPVYPTRRGHLPESKGLKLTLDQSNEIVYDETKTLDFLFFERLKDLKTFCATDIRIGQLMNSLLKVESKDCFLKPQFPGDSMYFDHPWIYSVFDERIFDEKLQDVVYIEYKNIDDPDVPNNNNLYTQVSLKKRYKGDLRDMEITMRDFYKLALI